MFAGKRGAQVRIRRDLQGLDPIDRRILGILQDDCKTPLAKVGEQVELSPPAVLERVHRLEEEGFIRGYQAILDARRFGIDVTAFIGVSIGHPDAIARFEGRLAEHDDVLECHHVTGEHTLLLKVKTRNTQTLEALIRALRGIEGVERTQTSVVLSTKVERSSLGRSAISPDTVRPKRARANGSAGAVRR
jgi:Lrp/AsnC family leucine-responsive transcriptional regulator